MLPNKNQNSFLNSYNNRFFYGYLSIFSAYFWVFFLIANTDITFLRGNDNVDLLVFIFLSFVFYFYTKFRINKQFVYLILIITSIVLIQVILYGGSFFTIARRIASSFLVPYFILRLIGLKNFIKALVNLTTFFTALSLVFWTVENISPAFSGFLDSIIQQLNLDPAFGNSVVIYNKVLSTTQSYFGLYRNSIIWHEPGASAVLVFIAFVFNHQTTNKLFNKKGIILTLGLLSTFSTAGYLTYLLYIAMYQYINRKLRLVYKIGILMVFIPLFIYLYLTLTFLNEKIQTQYSTEMSYDLNETQRGRFFGLRKEINTMINFPLHGRGFITDTLPEKGSAYAVAYGTFAIGATIGLIPFIAFIFIFFKSTQLWLSYYHNEKNAFVVFLCFFIINISQSVIFGTLFAIILLMYTMNGNPINKKSVSIKKVNSLLRKHYMRNESISFQNKYFKNSL